LLLRAAITFKLRHFVGFATDIGKENPYTKMCCRFVAITTSAVGFLLVMSLVVVALEVTKNPLKTIH